MKIVIYIALCCLHLSVRCQIWLPVGNGTDNGLGGGGIYLKVYRDKLIASGEFAHAGNIAARGIAAWNGSFWEAIDTSFFFARANGPMSIFQNELYTSVDMDWPGPTTMLKLDANFMWHQIPNSEFTDVNGNLGSIYCMTVYHNELYVGGKFAYVGNVNVNNIARWDGNTWHPVGSGTNPSVINMEVYNDELYVCGYFSQAGGINTKGIARWDGQTWHPVGIGMQSGNSIVEMKVYKDKLYLGGQFTKMGNQNTTNIAVWDGVEFAPVGNGAGNPNLPGSPSNDFLWGMGVFMNKLYVGGYFGPWSGIFANKGAIWDGSQWDSLPRGLNSATNDFEYYDCRLYAGGSFSIDSLNGVAMLDIYDCTMDVAETPTQKETPAIFPNPTQGHISIRHGSDILGVEIFDWAGKKLSEKYSETTSQNHSFDLSPYPPGMYTVRIIFEHGTYAAKVIRQ